MSGICGLLNLDRASVSPSLLQQLTDFLQTRGPDGKGVWSDDYIGLGHTLFITTREAQQQPFNLDDQVYLTADARLDGRGELIKTLQQQGHDVESHCPDVELIAHSYQLWGEHCLDYLQGDFVFVLWDRRESKLFGARDQLGVKPFYYARIGQQFIVSNTLNCLRLHPRISGELNEEAIADFLLFDMKINPEITTFTDIKRLPGGHKLIITGESLQISRYWTLPVPDLIRYPHTKDYLEHFQTVLTQAVSDRTRLDRVSILFSGGLDSTNLAVTALQSQPSLDLKGLTLIYEHLIPDREGFYASIAAQALHLPLQYLRADNYHLYQGWENPRLIPPEPTNNLFPQFSLDRAHLLTQHSPVALYGQGGDEAFRLSTVTEALQGMPWPIVLMDLIRTLVIHQLRPEWGTGWLSKLRPRQSLGYLPNYPTWLNPDWEKRLNLRDRWHHLTQDTPSNPHPWRSRAYQALLQPLWSANFEAIDPGFSSFPLEIRFPFLDLRLLNFVLALSPFPWCIDKQLLRLNLAPYLPPEITQRPKTPLAGHPYYTLLQQGANPWQELATMDRLHPYVDLPRLQQEIATTPLEVSRSWRQLRAVSLGYWLQQVDRPPYFSTSQS